MPYFYYILLLVPLYWHVMQGWCRCYQQYTGKNQRAPARKQAMDKVQWLGSSAHPGPLELQYQAGPCGVLLANGGYWPVSLPESKKNRRGGRRQKRAICQYWMREGTERNVCATPPDPINIGPLLSHLPPVFYKLKPRKSNLVRGRRGLRCGSEFLCKPVLVWAAKARHQFAAACHRAWHRPVVPKTISCATGAHTP